MEIRDLLVATVALVLGCMMLHTSILDQGWFFQMKISRVIAESKGRMQARTFVGSVGALMITIGLYLILAPFTLSFLQPNDDQTSAIGPSDGSMLFAESD